MNFEWASLTDKDMEIIDTWKSEDIRDNITIDDTFTISELFDLFGKKDRSNTVKAMDENGNIVGIVLFDNGIYDYSIPAFMNIQFLIVDPSRINNGIGTKMMQDIIEANKGKVDIFQVYSEQDNYACMRILDKLGFKTNKKRDRHSNYKLYELDLRVQEKKRK